MENKEIVDFCVKNKLHSLDSRCAVVTKLLSVSSPHEIKRRFLMNCGSRKEITLVFLGNTHCQISASLQSKSPSNV